MNSNNLVKLVDLYFLCFKIFRFFLVLYFIYLYICIFIYKIMRDAISIYDIKGINNLCAYSRKLHCITSIKIVKRLCNQDCR